MLICGGTHISPTDRRENIVSPSCDESEQFQTRPPPYYCIITCEKNEKQFFEFRFTEKKKKKTNLLRNSHLIDCFLKRKSKPRVHAIAARFVIPFVTDFFLTVSLPFLGY